MTPDALAYLLVGAGLTLVSQVVIQLVIVPRVETRKRREDRWERDVLTFGELLTAEIPDRASSAFISQSVLQHFYHLPMPPGQILDAVTLERLKEESRTAVRDFRDVASTRIRWLLKRIISIAPDNVEIRSFHDRVYMYLMTATVCTFYSDGKSDDYDEDKYNEIWGRERKLRVGLADLVADMLRVAPPRNGRVWMRTWARLLKLGHRIQRTWSGRPRVQSGS